ncbi:MAG: ABC transporter permease [Geminicoccaceae bacterium]|nr:MAG: ABC transporter permease [Geminicoccaceae bacterium]
MATTTLGDIAATRPVATTEALRTADGMPLRTKLERSMRMARLRAFFLVAPLLAFIVFSFLVPVGKMLWLGVYEPTFANYMPRTAAALQTWDTRDLPSEETFAIFVDELIAARESRDLGKVASRVNREFSGARSLLTATGRRAADFAGPDAKQALIAHDATWGRTELWQGMTVAARSVTPAFYLNAVDLRLNADGTVRAQDADRRLHLALFWRTLWLSALITGLCLLLGFPVAYLLATLPMRYSNLLMILVLLPFWTSLLVRTTAWIALLQSQGVVNDSLVAIGIISDTNRLSMIYNQAGTVIAMTHILLPFMILPLYSVMKTIPPSYMRAARSLGANGFTAFRRVYLPQTVPGIGAGSLLVFILAVGYYITPALVGGQSGQLISNIIAFHMQSTLNWSLAAALGGVLLAGVLILYWTYNRLIGIDNIKLG